MRPATRRRARPPDRPVDRFAETFPSDGTDFQSALDAAARLLEAEYNATGRTRADIVISADGEAELDDAWVTPGARRARRGFRVFTVTDPDAEDPADLPAICGDARRIEDLTDIATTARLFRTT